MEWFDIQNQSEIICKFTIDSLAFQSSISEKISSVIFIISMLVISLGIAFYLGWILSVVVLICIPIIALCWYKGVTIRLKLKHIKEKLFLQSDVRVLESLSAIKLVKQMNAEEF